MLCCQEVVLFKKIPAAVLMAIFYDSLNVCLLYATVSKAGYFDDIKHMCVLLNCATVILLYVILSTITSSTVHVKVLIKMALPCVAGSPENVRKNKTKLTTVECLFIQQQKNCIQCLLLLSLLHCSLYGRK